MAVDDTSGGRGVKTSPVAGELDPNSEIRDRRFRFECVRNISQVGGRLRARMVRATPAGVAKCRKMSQLGKNT